MDLLLAREPVPAYNSCASAMGRCARCKVRLHSICAALDHEDLNDLDALAQSANFPPKHTLFVESEVADAVYSVTEGALRLYRLLPDGRRQIVGFALPGDFIGLSLASHHEFSADALNTVSACRFSIGSFINLIERKPGLLRRLHQFTAAELSAARLQMTVIGRLAADEKVTSFFLYMRDRWSRLNGPSATVPLPMNRQDIADFLGLTIETVSRIISKLSQQGILASAPNAIRLLDSVALERITEGQPAFN